MNGIMGHASGEFSITQDRLNEFLSEFVLSEIAVSCVCEGGSCLGLTICSKPQGTAHLRLRLIEAKHDRVATFVREPLNNSRW